MSKSYVVAVVGATGLVGQEMLRVLEQRKFPVSKLVPLASGRSAGAKVRFQGKEWQVSETTADSFAGVQVALFSAGNPISIEFAPKAAAAGAIVIDNSSAFRLEPTVPLIVPEVNGEALKGHKNIIANPNCSTAQLVMALKPLHDAATMKRVVVSTYQSVSGWGKEAMEELKIQIEAYLKDEKITPHVLQKQIAFNLIPHIDKFQENGYTKEEMKMILETRKIMGLPNLAMTATCVRVPVMVSHSESVNVQFEKKLTAAQARSLMASFPNVKVIDDPAKNGYPTPLEAAGKDETFVGRVREDESAPNALDFWVVADNLRKGAALNAVQIAEELISRNLL